MANTFTSNYNFIKSEIGGDNASWGSNLHTTLGLADTAISKLLEDQIVSGVTSSAIDIRKDNATNTISTDADLKYFESIVVGDKIRVSGSDQTANGTAAAPQIHTVTAKSSANSITVNNNLIQDTSHTITVAKVLEPVHINSGPIVCAPLTSLSNTTRVAGGTGQPGTGSNKDGTDALKANGDVTLGGSLTDDTVTFTSKIASDLIPNSSDRDLGASGSSAWKDLHISGTATLATATVSAGSLAGITSITFSGTSGSYTNYSIGSNGAGSKTVSTSAPSSTSGYSNGDLWYEIP